MNCSTPGFPVLHYLPKFAQTRFHWKECHPTISSSVTPFSSCPQSFPTSGSFPMSWLLPIRWPKYRSFSLSISPSNEYSGLISFRIDWFDLLEVQGTLKSLLHHHSLNIADGNVKMLQPLWNTWLASWETCMQVRKQQLELDMEQQTGSK